MNFLFEINFDDFKIALNIRNFTPGRDMPACQNPDSPLYSDQGESAEYDIESAVFEFERSDGPHVIPVPAAFADYLADINAEEIINQGEALCQAEREDAEYDREIRNARARDERLLRRQP
jgi:hypothetical protein